MARPCGRSYSSGVGIKLMEQAFWHQCWQQQQLGFQLAEPHPLLQAHLADVLASKAGALNSIVLPLCGKSPDLMFGRQFLPVTGFELSPIACHDFFSEQGLSVTVDRSPAAAPDFVQYQSSDIALWQGDFFQVPAALIQRSVLLYDRAALIALPAPMRRAYADKLKQWLALGASVLLISLEYPEAERQGPPFAVLPDELAQLFSGYQLTLLQSLDITGQGFGRRRLATSQLWEKIWLIE